MQIRLMAQKETLVKRSDIHLLHPVCLPVNEKHQRARLEKSKEGETEQDLTLIVHILQLKNNFSEGLMSTYAPVSTCLYVRRHIRCSCDHGSVQETTKQCRGQS